MAEPSSYKPLRVDDARTLDDMRLLRGVPATNLFAWFGFLLSAPSLDSQHFSNNTEAESWYAASAVVTNLSWFISHSWRDSRWLKYVTLLWLSNSGVAFVSGNFVALLWAIAEATGMPCPTATMTYPSGVKNVFGLSWAVYSIVFLVVLTNGHKMKRCRIEDSYFLDKCCICQSDPVLKAHGISSLGGFLTHSKRLAILYSSDYVNRLWCIYEIACFCSKKSPREVDFMPLQASLVTCAMFVSSFAYCVLLFASSAASKDDRGLTGEAMSGLGQIAAMFWVAFSFGNARLVRSRFEMQAGLETFSFDKSKCYCCDVGHVLASGESIPCDRKFVASNVEKWFSSQDGCESQEGTRRFEEYVRSNLSTRAIQGPPIMPFPWQTFFLISMVIVWLGVDIAILSPDVRIRLGNAIEFCLFPFFLMLLGASIGIAVKCCPCRNNGWVITMMMDSAISLIVIMVFTVLWLLWDALVQDVNTPLYQLVVVFIGVVSLAYLLHEKML
eukprot:TRINITY_DN10215_c2_g1_i1.p1 TRINITY_DN10215_c2_g1~~TRINITY_DN10215_c2_g1_i1.p1  ORF type:complete len:527 (-),score=13.87 TRINITY_DN10215_c2_g1_i1:88-1584(-)